MLFVVCLRVLIVNIIADPDKLLLSVTAGDKDYCDAQYVASRYLGRVGGICLEDELVDADRNGANEDLIEDLVMGGVLSGTDVEDFPFKIVIEGLEAFEGDFEGKWREERGGVA